MEIGRGRERNERQDERKNKREDEIEKARRKLSEN
jgi:hypothetical protein